MTIRISKHSWFVRFSTIIWFWIEITSSIEFWLTFDLSFESESDSESDLDQLSDHLLDQLLLTAVQICLRTIASDADIAFDHRLSQSTWRLTFWSARQLSDSVFLTDIWSWSYIQITSQLIWSVVESVLWWSWSTSNSDDRWRSWSKYLYISIQSISASSSE